MTAGEGWPQSERAACEMKKPPTAVHDTAIAKDAEALRADFLNEFTLLTQS
jgi:hypothetical protein